MSHKKIRFLRLHFRFSQRLYTLECWENLLGKFTDFSEGYTTYIFRVQQPKKTELTYSEFGDIMLHRNGYIYQSTRRNVSECLYLYLFTYLLTPCCRVLLEKLTGLQLVKKFPAFHGTRRFITVFTSASIKTRSLITTGLYLATCFGR